MAEEVGWQGTATEMSASANDGARRGQTLKEARDAVRSVADAQKGKVASRLSGVAEALHETAKNLERQNAVVGRYADMAAQQVDRVSQALKERGVEELVGNAEELARSQPLLFVGGALAAGFILARVVKNSEPEEGRRGGLRRGAEGARDAESARVEGAREVIEETQAAAQQQRQAAGSVKPAATAAIGGEPTPGGAR